MPKTPITVAHGDGIGPEIMRATLRILEAAGAQIEPEVIEVGEKLYLQGNTTGLGPDAWESIRRTKVFLKAPITTPQGGGYKSLNVTIRKTLGLYANVRPCVSYHPFVDTKHPKMDLVIVRENEEDLYAGIEHRQTDEVAQCLKLITLPGSEKIIRYAFEFAKLNGRKKVTCFSKDNIMKITDGMFHKAFDRIAKEYPEIESEHWIVDIGTALLADKPERFDVIVLPNLYGDILSDVAAQITGSVGMGSSANIGKEIAMFEAVHGSAPDIAGKGIANPSGLLLSAVNMMVHIGQPEVATTIHNAWLKALEDGVHTGELYKEGLSTEKVGTDGLAEAIVERLGQKPSQLKPVQYASKDKKGIQGDYSEKPQSKKELVGVDVFLHWTEDKRDPNALGEVLRQFESGPFSLQMITNRGIKVFPDGFPETYCTDHWRCRFSSKAADVAGAYDNVLEICHQINSSGLDIIKTENLCRFDGEMGFSLGQGQ